MPATPGDKTSKQSPSKDAILASPLRQAKARSGTSLKKKKKPTDQTARARSRFRNAAACFWFPSPLALRTHGGFHAQKDTPIRSTKSACGNRFLRALFWWEEAYLSQLSLEVLGIVVELSAGALMTIHILAHKQLGMVDNPSITSIDILQQRDGIRFRHVGHV
ncbi:hypothetical protein BaRGS_00018488 [Batillaria attramentaria]|uniref:Uncharacterized protein n=1 Tax=Batillaria attramentaria TaxID=370345 RepID=A0ABD0KT36_9CAEN